MASSNRFPFSDLTPDQVRELVQTARAERNVAIRSWLSRLFRWPGNSPVWPQRQREAQVWTPKNVHALSLQTHC